MTQKEFADTINKTRDWQASNETGRSRYFIDDLIYIAKIHNLEIIIKDIYMRLIRCFLTI